MKLMHIISSLEMGGAQAVLYDLVVQFQKMGYEQTIIYMHDGPYRQRFEKRGVSVQKVNGVIAPFDPVCLYHLIREMRKTRPDCVHTVLWAANWLGRLAARLLAIPCVASLHNNYDQNGTVRALLDRIVPYHNRAIVAVSEEVAQSFAHVYPAVSPVTVIPNGIDMQAVRKRAVAQHKTRAQLGLSNEHFVIGSVGRFHPIKRYPFLLDVFAHIHKTYPHARLLLVGGGPQEQQLREYAEKLKIGPFVRWVVGQQAYGYYRLFDCFVLSSEKEGISIALLEAMSLGIPPVVTYHTGQHPVITDGVTGHVAKSNNATDCAGKIGLYITNKMDAQSVGKSAQQVVRDCFAIDSMIAAYNRVFCTDSDMQEERSKN